MKYPRPVMRILIICPGPRESRHGNRMTARRWAGILRKLGHRAWIAKSYDDEPCDILIALHARKSAAAVERFRRRYPGRYLIVALTGTDLYGDIRRSLRARKVLDLATRLVVLQPLGVREIPAHLRARVRVVHQSAPRLRRRPRPASRTFDVCVIGHLRPVKDPFRTALAARRLPQGSRIRVFHFGQAMSAAMERRARAEESMNPRYRWLGDRPHAEVRAVVARARLMVISSRAEGGANVVSEALAAGLPMLASRIPGNVGLLGGGYPGYFDVGDTRNLADLLRRSEADPGFYRRLARACARRAKITSPALEARSWRELIREGTTMSEYVLREVHTEGFAVLGTTAIASGRVRGTGEDGTVNLRPVKTGGNR